MNNNFFNEMQPTIIERLGNIYNQNSEYQQALKNEAKLFEKIEGDFSEVQIQTVKSYYNLAYTTWGICEMLAYRQGMRDMAAILGIAENYEN